MGRKAPSQQVPQARYFPPADMGETYFPEGEVPDQERTNGLNVILVDKNATPGLRGLVMGHDALHKKGVVRASIDVPLK